MTSEQQQNLDHLDIAFKQLPKFKYSRLRVYGIAYKELLGCIFWWSDLNTTTLSIPKNTPPSGRSRKSDNNTSNISYLRGQKS